MIIRLISLVNLLLFFLPLPQGEGREITIVAFGDSTTAVRVGVDRVYAQRLEDLLEKLV